MSNGEDQARLQSISFSNGKGRNNFKPQQSAERLVERYNSLAKEALASGDKILSENYFQHADHFMRIIEDKNLNQNRNKQQIDSQQKTTEANLNENVDKEPTKEPTKEAVVEEKKDKIV